MALGPKPRKYTQKTPKKMVRLALRSALSDRAAEGKVLVVDAWGFDAPKTKDAKAALAALGVAGPGPRRPHRRRRRGRTVVPQPPRGADHQLPRGCNAYDVLVNDYVVFTQDNLPTSVVHRGSRATLRRTRVKDPRDVIIASGRLREVLRPDRAERLHVHRPPRRRQARDPQRDRGDLRRQGGQGEHAQPQGQAQAQPPHRQLGSRPDTKRAIVTLAEGDAIDLFKEA